MDILENLVKLLREATEAGKTEVSIYTLAKEVCEPEIKKRNAELNNIEINLTGQTLKPLNK